MNLISLLSTILLAAGLYLLFAQALHLPSFATTRTVLNLSRHSTVKVKRSQAIIIELSTRAAKFIHLDDYKKKKLTATLKAADISIPPETWIARCYVRFALLLFCVLPMLKILPIVTPVLIGLAVRQLFTDLKSAEMLVIKKRSEIERDLPRFTSTIAQELRSTRNVLAIFKGYVKSARPALRAELEMTIADMNSGNHELALTRLDTRVGSSMLSQVVRGLQAVLRGDDSSTYFELLAHDFDMIDENNLNLEAAKIPPKVNVCIGVIFVCFAIVIFYVLGTQIGQSYAAFNM